MTYNQFIESIKSRVCIEWKTDRKFNRIKTDKSNEFILEHSYMTSYVGGGSCWDNGNSNHYTKIIEVTEEDTKFKSLDKLLEIVASNISLVDYREICKLIKKEYRTETEYYGNSTDYVFLTIELELLYKKLVELNYLRE